MYVLEKSFTFEASHVLSQHDGKCARLHGHSWKGILILQSNSLIGEGPKFGMVIDYGDLSKIIDPMLDEYLDHHHLNESLNIYPTSENVAAWIHSYVQCALLNLIIDKPEYRHLELIATRIEETCTSAAAFYTGV